ncbi:MAG: LysR family transcriptional regulator [Thiobacillaceae bacterium]|jgi:LysR family transcriptional regulator, low CO2-responsive transcriptional regulator|nr:LysR family transcriptional regulator [Hydrogenophilales bacterium]MBP9915606.1 LysR family transcriptional regulator [Thiobacillaceae bacterium]
MLHLTLRQLQVFESAARHLSLSRAAEELHLSQPGVSMQMKKLTEAVGQPLMEQNGKRVQLTDQGQELVAASREILGALKRFELSLVARQGLTKGSLRLVAISTATYFVPRLLGEFAQLHPGVKVSLRVTNREQVLETLAAGLEDLYILGQPPEGLAVTAIPFMDNPLVVLAAPDHPLAHKKHISLARLAEEPWLLREPGSGTRKAVERIFAENGLSLTPRMELGNNEAIKQAVLTGLGISVLSRHTLALHDPAQFALLDVQGFPIIRQWYAVYPAGRQRTVVARTFLDFLLSHGTRNDAVKT